MPRPKKDIAPCLMIDKEEKVVILSAEQVLFGGRYPQETRILIRLLSENALTTNQILDAVRQNPDYSMAGLSDKQAVKAIGNRLCQKRLGGKIFGHRDSFWFVRNTKADPAIQKALGIEVLPDLAQLSLAVDLRSKRTILITLLFNLLIQQPHTLGRLVTKVRECPDYDSAEISDQVLRCRISNCLHQITDLFERQVDKTGSIPETNALWDVKSKAVKPTPMQVTVKEVSKSRSKIKYRPNTKSAILYRLMRSKWIIRGWSLAELYQAVSQPTSGYRISPDISSDRAMTQLRSIMRKPDEFRFERVTLDFHSRWRASWNGPLTIPNSSDTWYSSAKAVVDDLELDWSTITYDVVWDNLKAYGHLFGWDVLALPGYYVLKALNYETSFPHNKFAIIQTLLKPIKLDII